MPANGRAVFGCASDGNLEFAGQERKLGMQSAPLAQYFCKGAWIYHFVNGHTSQFIGGDVANAIATGLNAVHVDGGQEVHYIGRSVQRNPVELDVLSSCEMAIALHKARGLARQHILLGLRFGEQFGIGLIVFLGNLSQDVQLLAGDFAVGHSYAQHWGVALNVPAVLQAQRTKLFVCQLPFLPALKLVSVLGRAQFDKLAVKFCVLVHL